jgi:sulfate adenylyltransferase subunit 2
MDHLDQLENDSVYIIREAYKEFKDIAMLWSIGKDSTTLLYLVRKAFYGHVPFPILHLDTSYKFKEIYAFRDRMTKEWHLNLVIAQNKDALARKVGPDAGNKLTCCGELKTEALKQAIKEYGYRAILLGIRRDEHGIRAKERYFSPRNNQFQWDYKNQPAELWDLYKNKETAEEHIRVHPLLHWTELDIWSYIQREKIPIVDLYLARNKKRYRSIGCEPCCSPVPSDADTVDKIVEELKTTTVSERSGRAQDKERAYMMQKLRSMGYM